MNDSDRVIGKLEEAVRWIKADLSEIKSDVKALNQFKWRIMGGASVVATIVGVIVQLVLK